MIIELHIHCWWFGWNGTHTIDFTDSEWSRKNMTEKTTDGKKKTIVSQEPHFNLIGHHTYFQIFFLLSGIHLSIFFYFWISPNPFFNKLQKLLAILYTYVCMYFIIHLVFLSLALRIYNFFNIIKIFAAVDWNINETQAGYIAINE